MVPPLVLLVPLVLVLLLVLLTKLMMRGCLRARTMFIQGTNGANTPAGPVIIRGGATLLGKDFQPVRNFLSSKLTKRRTAGPFSLSLAIMLSEPAAIPERGGGRSA